MSKSKPVETTPKLGPRLKRSHEPEQEPFGAFEPEIKPIGASFQRPIKRDSGPKRANRPKGRQRGSMVKGDGEVKCAYPSCEIKFPELVVAGRVKRYCSNVCKCRDFDRRRPRPKVDQI